MIFLCIFLILLGVCTVAFVLYQCNIKITEYKRQILTLNNQLSKYKDTTYKKSNNDSKKNLIINFNKPEFRYGITLPYTSIFIAPSEESIAITKIKEKSQVKIIDEAEINNEIWYYSLLNTESKINCNGWIKKSQFSMLMEDTNNIIGE
ncbi:MAG: hypothetical protein E6682_12095 [Clostridium perfringens]|uniref:hypothetical protein n=1 Tax=Clostridium perfringens TaxID=1502 RepID=UPI0018AC35A4|nr:hypothetical protein [Clostridium perfringens]EHR1329061.1 hypothetical protein [Clostridium perfringens]EHR1332195.1 hypothetical protein [Clostridium perfringens]EHR1425701.1 hypothetical protein [Clostridium perfringens]EIF6165790.1 hypothetical protein [Clostridium perfringens]MDK0983938.1 hypothetical protein [Clostridium perfringens]